ncbi:hypothetical protein IMZ48_09145 [Candidatus Bathyarchaeota archaeon]|nr:hypothetical protein [Candidatus Bathyarchaeota archaeon]
MALIREAQGPDTGEATWSSTTRRGCKSSANGLRHRAKAGPKVMTTLPGSVGAAIPSPD